jgi:hypothetical protein
MAKTTSLSSRSVSELEMFLENAQSIMGMLYLRPEDYDLGCSKIRRELREDMSLNDLLILKQLRGNKPSHLKLSVMIQYQIDSRRLLAEEAANIENGCTGFM